MRVPFQDSLLFSAAHADAFDALGSRAPSEVRRHDVAVETLRGVACLLLVSLHVIGSIGSSTFIPEDSNWRHFAELFAYIRMPIFACISGYVFIAVASSWSELADLLKSKLRRLGIPLVVVSYLYFATSCAVHTKFCVTVTSPWTLVVYPHAHFWYIQSTLIIMFVVAASAFVMNSNRRLLTAIAFPISLSLALFGIHFSSNIFGVNNALYLLPFFLLGQTLSVWSVVPYFTSNPKQKWVALGVLGAILFFYLLILSQSVAELNLPYMSVASVFGISLSIVSCLFLFLLRPHIRLLASIGPFSYAIYLFHPIFISASWRLVLALDEGAPIPIVFAICLVAGIAFPIIVYHIAIRYRITALLLLGIDAKKVKLNNNPARANVELFQSGVRALKFGEQKLGGLSQAATDPEPMKLAS